jgi:hypothetical protein
VMICSSPGRVMVVGIVRIVVTGTLIVRVVVTGTVMEICWVVGCVTVTTSPSPGIVIDVVISSPGSVTVVGIVTVVSCPSPGMVRVVVIAADWVTVTGLQVPDGPVVVNVTVEGEQVAVFEGTGVEGRAGTTTELKVDGTGGGCAPPLLQEPKSFWHVVAAQ